MCVDYHRQYDTVGQSTRSEVWRHGLGWRATFSFWVSGIPLGKHSPWCCNCWGGKVWLGFRQVFTAGLFSCLYMCLLDLLVSRCGMVSELDMIKFMSKWFWIWILEHFGEEIWNEVTVDEFLVIAVGDVRSCPLSTSCMMRRFFQCVDPD